MQSKKLITSISMICLMAVLLIVGVWALTEVQFNVGGDIEYTAPIPPVLDESEYPTLIFEPIDSTTCSVADNGSSGALVIPDKVSIDGVEYTVTEFAEGDMYEPGVNGSFVGNRKITSIEIPGTITTISDHEFYSCTGLTSVIIKEGLQNIQDNAFFYCSALTQVSIPDSIVDVGASVFNRCNVQYNQINNGNYVGNTKSPYLVLISLNDTSATSFIMNDGCVLIAGRAFWDCDSLTTISVSKNLSYINSNALVGCSSLALITYGNAKYFGTTSNPYMLLVEAADTSITSCVIPASCILIMRAAFYNCTNLTSVTIPNSVTSIGESIFGNCIGLTSISIDSENGVYDSRNNCNAIIETATNTLIYGCKTTIIPDSVTSIGSYAFYDCTGLASVTIGNGVTSIGASAFNDCSGLTSITIPDSVTSIESSAFDGCTGLTSITIPDSVTSIGSLAFNGCTGLTSVTIGSGVTSIRALAFFGCTNLAEVNVKATSVPIGSGDMFHNCSSSLVIYVPTASESAYKAAYYWSDYSSKIQGKSF